MMAQMSEASEMRTELADLERDLRTLKSDLGQLEIDYKMFFAGQRKRPPYALRSTVEALGGGWTARPSKGPESASGSIRSTTGFGPS